MHGLVELGAQLLAVMHSMIALGSVALDAQCGRTWCSDLVEPGALTGSIRCSDLVEPCALTW
jgi:hypothetical protein